jgi:hypothetical protein
MAVIVASRITASRAGRWTIVRDRPRSANRLNHPVMTLATQAGFELLTHCGQPTRS